MLENTAAVATVCIESLTTTLQQDTSVVLQTQDATASGK